MVKESKVKVIDGDGLILGRVASYVAKHAMKGESFRIINAEKMVISGDRKNIVAKYVKRRNMKNKANPEHSPKWPKRPDLLVKRVIKGMLPVGKTSGRMALKNVRAYIGEETVDGERVKLNDSFKKDKLSKYITVLELCRALSYKC
ncbi:MAG: 50S ribosomal protein L13 [Candidatus Micrarchaeia archaeon]